LSPVPISVEPSRFAVVDFDAIAIADLAAMVAAEVGLPPSLPIDIVVDERSMLSRARLRTTDPVVIAVTSGAFEDRSRPRQMSDANVVDELARLLQRVADRRSAEFAVAPPEDDLTPQQAAAWDVACLGRTARWQAEAFETRHRYDFMLCCGFGAAAQQVFDRLWNGGVADWATVAALASTQVP
jgi:hypothetical protein